MNQLVRYCTCVGEPWTVYVIPQCLSLQSVFVCIGNNVQYIAPASKQRTVFALLQIIITYCRLVDKKLSYRRETARQLCSVANWSCNAQNTAESQMLYHFWHSNALIQELLAENAFCHEIATQDHSRSFILQSFAGRQGVAYRHIILLAVSLKFSKT